MGPRKPEFSGTTRSPRRNRHDSQAIGRNDHSLGTRQDASLSLCDSGGLSRGSSLVEKWIRVHMPSFWKPFGLSGTHGTPYFPCESISFLVFFPIESRELIRLSIVTIHQLSQDWMIPLQMEVVGVTCQKLRNREMRKCATAVACTLFLVGLAPLFQVVLRDVGQRERS